MNPTGKKRRRTRGRTPWGGGGVMWLPGRWATPGRRKLAFGSLTEVMADVERLLTGHATLGQWTLGQICNHLAATIRMSTDQVPQKAPWLVRRTAGVVLRRLMLARGRI